MTIDPANPEHVQSVAHMSAPNMYAYGLMPLLLVSLGRTEVCVTPAEGGEPVCTPSTEDCPSIRTEADGSSIIEGGCTTENGITFSGRATVSAGFSLDSTSMEMPPQGTITYEALEVAGPSECPTATGVTSHMRFDGQLTVSKVADLTSFTVDVEMSGDGIDDDCMPIEGSSGIYEYSGSMQETPSSTAGETIRVWNGSGRVGLVTPDESLSGRLEARTENETIDSTRCNTEAASGATTVIAGDDTLVFTYDGATDCDETSTVSWSFNGTAQGEIEHVRCSVTGGPGAGAPAAPAGLVGIAIGVTAAITRRRSRRRTADTPSGR